jgi:hypothetical protein
MTRALAVELRKLEERLLDPVVRCDRSAMASLLAAEFVEFGSSGRVFTREQVLDLLATEMPCHVKLADFSAQPLSPEVVLVTWRSIRPDGPPVPGEAFLRSSIWIHRDNRWQMVFHQGTRAANTEG